MTDAYPWRLKGCPYPQTVVCPCIRQRSFFDCHMRVENYKEQQETLTRLRNKED